MTGLLHPTWLSEQENETSVPSHMAEEWTLFCPDRAPPDAGAVSVSHADSDHPQGCGHSIATCGTGVNATRMLSWRRIAAWSLSLVLHVGLFGMLAARPDVPDPLPLGASDRPALIVEFLPSVPVSAAIALPTVPVVRPKRNAPNQTPQRSSKHELEPRRHAEADAVVVTELPLPVTAPEAETTAMPSPMPTEPVVAEAVIAKAEPDREAHEQTDTATVEAPLTARGKRAQTQYLRELMAWLAKHRVYPAEAKKQKVEGVVHVRFLIDRQGRLLRAAIHRSAQSSVLDAAALDVLQRANPMPPFPKSLDRQRLNVTLPIDFSLITD